MFFPLAETGAVAFSSLSSSTFLLTIIIIIADVVGVIVVGVGVVGVVVGVADQPKQDEETRDLVGV